VPAVAATTGELSPGSTAPDPLAGTGGGELWAQVAALPVKQRTAVTLRFIADSSYAEIATVMETSEEAARRNVHEALKRLRKDPPSP
jgi:DNA-directed RNA polymerase specialized sigma24 family protein